MSQLLASAGDHAGDTFTALVNNNVTITKSTFLDCHFVNCSFQEVSWEDCRFVNCDFQNCNLSLTSLRGCTLHAVQFTECLLTGINWSYIGQGKAHHLSFIRSQLNYATFVGLGLMDMTMRNCTAREAYFADCTMKQVDFRGTDFTGATFMKNNLSGANFTKARHYAISPLSNTLTKARFDLPEAMNLLYGLDIILDDGREK